MDIDLAVEVSTLVVEEVANMEFWSGFFGALVGAGIAGVITLVVHWLASADAKRRERDAILDRLFNAASQLGEAALDRGKTPMPLSALFAAHDFVAQLRRTTRSDTEAMQTYALNRIVILYAYDNVGAISAARTSLTAGLSRWARAPRSRKTRAHLKQYADIGVAGEPVTPITSAGG